MRLKKQDGLHKKGCIVNEMSVRGGIKSIVPTTWFNKGKASCIFEEVAAVA